MKILNFNIRPIFIGWMLRKGIVIFLFFSLILIKGSLAQEKKIKIGVCSGLIYSNFSETDGSSYTPGTKFELKQLPGITIGLRASYQIKSKIDLSSGLNYDIYRYYIEQQSFPSSGLQGWVRIFSTIQGTEIPLLVTFFPSYEKGIFNNLSLSIGSGVAFYRHSGISSKGHLMMIPNDTISWLIYEPSFPSGKTLLIPFKFGFGKKFFTAKRSFQINFWYSKTFTEMNVSKVTYMLNNKHTYEVGTKPKLAAFKFELVYYPFSF